MKPQYPNLELIEYKFKQLLHADNEWQEILKEVCKEKPFMPTETFDIIVFPQIWSSTCTAFDICEDGTPAYGGQAMTKAYTVVIEENLTNTYGVFIDGKACYKVYSPTDEFYNDLKNRKMKSLAGAEKCY